MPEWMSKNDTNFGRSLERQLTRPDLALMGPQYSSSWASNFLKLFLLESFLGAEVSQITLMSASSSTG